MNKTLKAEISRLEILARGTNCFVTTVSDECTSEMVVEMVAEIHTKFPEMVFMIVTSSANGCNATVCVPVDDQVVKSKWLEYSGFTVVENNGSFASGELVCNDSFKKKDELMAKSFEYLRKCGILEELDSDSEDELPYMF